MPRAPQTLNAKRIKWVIGALIATQRKKKRMSQRELAQKAGCSIQELDAYEGGNRNLPIWKLVEMAWALEVHPSYFFSGLECHPKEDRAVEGTALTAPFPSSGSNFPLQNKNPSEEFPPQGVLKRQV